MAIAAGGKPDASKGMGDYEVGYKKPPKETRFQPGQSGNPNGRPKGAKNLKTDLAEELQERIALREGGERRTVSKQRGMLKRLMERALNGDTRAAALIINMVARFLDQTEDEEHATPLTDTDRAILEDYVARVTGKSRSTT
jgi:Family of unknown function (DUF5681)